MIKRCLYCYEELLDPEVDFHPSCSQNFFRKKSPPVFVYTEQQLIELAKQTINSRIAVTGVQPKLSLSLKQLLEKNAPAKFTIVGLWGDYILKLPSATYAELPELEDVTMHMAELAKISTVPHTLFRLQSGQLAYVTKRIDRSQECKLHMEDMCQLSDRLTEHKYRGSYEQIGKLIVKYSVHPGLDVVNFFEQVVFSFLTGNADMHLKNFSLLLTSEGYHLCPAYDLVPTALVVKGDMEELALTLNGKKRKFKRDDFLTAMGQFKLDDKVINNIFKKMQTAWPSWVSCINNSFLSDEMKSDYHQLIEARMQQIGLTNQ
ncbi:MAG: HipA domain-containing protein [Cyclobacteriaceae bacterium]|jgi:serine/threonine-protein kinase HipA|nr:HipA domain-containing protein [Flammeovirgaceae bacterium]